MTKQWYYEAGGKQYGPFSEEQLAELARSDQLQTSDLVWHDGMPDWLPYGTVNEVVGSRKPKPPHLPVSRAATPSPAGLAELPTSIDNLPFYWKKFGLWRFAAV